MPPPPGTPPPRQPPGPRKARLGQQHPQALPTAQKPPGSPGDGGSRQDAAVRPEAGPQGTPSKKLRAQPPCTPQHTHILTDACTRAPHTCRAAPPHTHDCHLKCVIGLRKSEFRAV